MNKIKNDKFVFEETKVKSFQDNKNTLTFVQIATKVNDAALRTRNYVTRYEGLSNHALTAKLFNDMKKSILDYISNEEIVKVTSVNVAIGTKFSVLDEKGLPTKDQEGKEVYYTSDKEEVYLVVDYDKEHNAILVRSPLGNVLNKAVSKEDKKQLNAFIDEVCNVLVDSITVDRLQSVYLSQLPEKEIEEGYKQHINDYMGCVVETKDSFRRAILPIYQAVLLEKIPESEDKEEYLKVVLNKTCYSSFFNSIVSTINKEALPKKAKKCDVKALKHYVITRIAARPKVMIEEDMKRVLTQFK